jgi:hypothetical protein
MARFLKPRDCRICGRTFRPAGSSQRTCDDVCRTVDRRRQRAVRAGGSVPELTPAATPDEPDGDVLSPDELRAYDALVEATGGTLLVDRDDRGASQIRIDLRLGMLNPMLFAP